jgi:hypothetical protein
MQKPENGNYKNFYNIFRINQLISRGINPNGFSYLSSVITRKLLVKLHLYKY